MPVRTPAVAGQFYPQSTQQCRAEVEQCLSRADSAGSPPVPAGFEAVGGIAPHAGWICSGAVAGEVIRVLASSGRPDRPVETFVVFGAAHQRMATPAAVYDRGAWETPLGQVAVDEELAERVVRAAPGMSANVEVHQFEHSIEVEVPFIQYLAPAARILPILVPPSHVAVEVGRVAAQAAGALGRGVVFLGSTDLTHYGPRYRFTPMGCGANALRWAKEVNDRRLLDLVEALKSDQVVPEALEHYNACGSGAVAAAMEASKVMGADRAQILRHTTSNEVAQGRFGEMADAVGYAGVIFVKSVVNGDRQ